MEGRGPPSTVSVNDRAATPEIVPLFLLLGRER